MSALSLDINTNYPLRVKEKRCILLAIETKICTVLFKVNDGSLLARVGLHHNYNDSFKSNQHRILDNITIGFEFCLTSKVLFLILAAHFLTESSK